MAREAIFAAVLFIAGALVTAGAAVLHPAAGLIVAGVLLGPWAWLILSEDDE